MDYRLMRQNPEIAMYDTLTGWSNMDGGFNTGAIESVFDIKVFNDEVVAAGRFTQASGKMINNIARWDGSEWYPLGGGTNTNINYMVVDTMNNLLYCSGAFSFVDGIVFSGPLAKWDGYNWSKVGGYFDGSVSGQGMCMYRNEFFIGGTSLSGSGVMEEHIQRWDGEQWLSVGGGVNVDARFCRINSI